MSGLLINPYVFGGAPPAAVLARPARTRRRRWVPDPSAQINWSHPLAAGLVMFAVPSHAMDYATGLRLTQGGTSRSATPFGPGETGFSSSAYWQVGTGPLLGNKSTFSVFAGLRGPSSTVSTGRPIYLERASSGNDICKLDCATQFVGDGTLVVTYRDDAGTLTQTAASTSILNRQCIGGLVRTSNSQFELWLDGNRDGSVAPGGMTSTFTNSSIQRRISTDPAAPTDAQLSDAVVSWVAGWTRALSPNEIADLQTDPFQMFR